MSQSIKWWLFFFLGIYFFSILTIIPLATEYQWYRPQWVLMFLLYCQLTQPKYFNPFIAWCIGLLMDSLLGNRLGEYALVYSVVCYLAAFIRPRFILKPLWQQIGKISLLICLGQIFILWFHALAGHNPHTLLYWMGTVTSCALWPLFVKLLQFFSQTLKVVPIPSRGI